MSYNSSGRTSKVPDSEWWEVAKSGRCCLLFLLVFFGILISLIIWYRPSVHPTFKIKSAFVSIEDSTWTVGFSVRNPSIDSKVIYYKYIEVSVEDGTSSGKFSTTLIPPFTQPQWNNTLINSTVVMTSWPDYSATSDHIQPGPKLYKYGLVFMTTVKFRAAYRISDWPDSGNYVRDHICNGVIVGFPSNESQGVLLLKGSIKCRDQDHASTKYIQWMKIATKYLQIQ